MTTGYLEILLGNSTISGHFVNGLLKIGIITKPDVTYQGAFDDNQFLHGDNCEEIRNHLVRRGKFEHGYLVEGVCIRGLDAAEGKFEHNVLAWGTCMSNEVKYEGEFKFGKLTKGTIYYPTEVHQGYFIDGKLREGTIVNSDKTFCAKITFDGTDLKECVADCTCSLDKLNSVQLTILCCAGMDCQEAYRFYKSYFAGKSAKKIIMSKINDNIHATFDNILGYQQIRENVDKYIHDDIHDVPLIKPYIDIFNCDRYNSHY